MKQKGDRGLHQVGHALISTQQSKRFCGRLEMEQADIMNLLVFLTVIAIYGLIKVVFRLLFGDNNEI